MGKHKKQTLEDKDKIVKEFKREAEYVETRKEVVEAKKYVHWYNSERIQKKLGYLSHAEYRLKYS